MLLGLLEMASPLPRVMLDLDLELRGGSFTFEDPFLRIDLTLYHRLLLTMVVEIGGTFANWSPLHCPPLVPPQKPPQDLRPRIRYRPLERAPQLPRLFKSVFQTWAYAMEISWLRGLWWPKREVQIPPTLRNPNYCGTGRNTDLSLTGGNVHSMPTFFISVTARRFININGTDALTERKRIIEFIKIAGLHFIHGEQPLDQTNR